MNIFSEKVPVNMQEEIKDFILNSFDAELKPKQYAFWEIKHKDFTAVFYNSSKFVIQGKNIDVLLEKLSEKFSSLFTFHVSQKQTSPKKINGGATPLLISHPLPYIGTDESGKGDFFGPLCVAGVMITEKNRPIFEDLGIKDSKTLKDADMLKMAVQIQKHSVYSVVCMSNAKYNELYAKFKNLNKLLAWGHARVIENILEKTDCERRLEAETALSAGTPFNASNQEQPCEYALSDKFGDESLILNALQKRGQKIQLEQRTKAESDIAVAAASVLARATFVQKMKTMENFYGCRFPKGCNNIVKSSAGEFIQKYGKERLVEVCKAHFKTYNEV